MALRILFFAGLVFHKLVWEWMKRGAHPVSEKARSAQMPVLKRAVKTVKILVLVFLVIQTLFLNILPILKEPAVLKAAGTILYFAGLVIAILGRVQLGANWANLEDYQILSNQNLVQSGIYRYIRHPIYAGDLLLVFGLELALNSWLVLGAVGLALVVFRQTLAEERILSQTFSGYGAYRRRTKMFIPFVV